MNKIDSTNEVSGSQLIERINRRLAAESQNRKDSRLDKSPSFGHFYAQSEPAPEENASIDIESIGRELGVLKDSERVRE